MSLIGGLAAALTLGARKSGALLALLALPLCVPTLIFGAGAIETLAAGEGIVTHVAILAGSGIGRPGHDALGDCRSLAASRRIGRMGPMADLHFLANPARFRRFSQRVLPGLGFATALMIAVGFYMAFFVAPPDYQQGKTVRIMFVHVPSAWLSMGGYALLAALGASLLVWRHPLAALMARAAAPVGASFAAVCLLTGSLWGRPMWGTYWVWDARLTSMLLLFFLYLGHIALSRAYDLPERGDRAAAILALIGVINLPIIKFSVDWWNTLHQPASITRLDAPAIHNSILVPLLWMAVLACCSCSCSWCCCAPRPRSTAAASRIAEAAA